MEGKDSKKFYLGLDIGTDSVGFAVTDESYNLIRKQGKHLWGSRLFDEASDASGRRANRAARRRYQRRRQRILLLRDLFKEEMDKVDPNFFGKLDSSSLHEEDKPADLAYDIAEIEARETYKTIYHLRKALLTEDRKFDIRQVYLVIAHALKYRGNFLREGTLSAGGVSAEEIVESVKMIDEILMSLVQDDDDDEPEEYRNIEITIAQAKSIIELFKKDMGKRARAEEVSNILFGSVKAPDKSKDAVVRFICGGKVKLDSFFEHLKEDDPEIGKKSINSEEDDFEDFILDFGLTDDENSLLIECKKLADDLLLVNLLKGSDSITKAMIAIYDDYGKDLKALRALTKGLVKGQAMTKEEYDDFWNGVKGVTYTTFSGTVGHAGLPEPVKACKAEEFLEQVVKLIEEGKNIPGLEDVCSYLEGRDEAGKLFERQNSKHNGVFPYQLNENELRKIIEQQGKYYPFLLNKDKGFPNPNKEDYKILSLLRYRIPYYVGPLSNPVNGSHLPNHWIVKKDYNTKITPWNFFDVVDRAASAEAFMRNLRNTCTYIKCEETLPKFSLLFQKYKVLNELNNLQVNNRPLTVEEKKYLFDNVYLKKKTVKASDIKAALERKCSDKSISLTPRNKNDEEKTEKVIQSSLSAYVDCKKIFGEDFYKDKELFEKAEKVIYIITAFEDKQTRSDQLAGLLTPEQREKAAALSFKKYSRFSRKLLDGLKTKCLNKETGEILDYSILDLMWNTNQNFMEIYEGGTYDFKEQVEKLNTEYLKDKAENPLKDLIDESYVSPGMKRSLFQAMGIIKELQHILHIDHFDKVFVECARAKSKNKKTPDSRKKGLEKYIKAANKAANKVIDDSKRLLAELNLKTDSELRSKRLYLYFMQLGRDVYTGEVIDLEKLSSNYDIDHIIPQALVKDDSFLNTVLVSRAKNNSKGKEYPLREGFITPKAVEWIHTLHGLPKIGPSLMPKEKMNRILRKDELRDDELIGFINRQLVYTNQAVKAVCDILKLTSPKTEVIYSKAGLVSDFRGMFKLPKVRDLNDFHHANDAYLNIVVGDIYNQKFNNRITQKWIEEIRQTGGSYKAGPEWIFRHLEKTRDGRRVIWVPCDYKIGEDGKEVQSPRPDSTINLVRKTLSWNDPMVTFRTSMPLGEKGFFEQISYRKAFETGEGNFPLKKVPEGKDPVKWMKKYGSYHHLKTSYYSLIRSKKKKKFIYSLEGIPAIIQATFSKDHFVDDMITYFHKQGLIEPEVIIERIPINTILKVPVEGGFVRLTIAGRSDDNRILCKNASELRMDDKHKSYYKMLCNIIGSNAPAGQKKDLSKYEGSNCDQIIEGEQVVTRDGNIEMLNYLINKISCTVAYSKLPEVGNQLNKLILNHANFETLTVIDQCQSLNVLCELLTCKSVQGRDLSLFDNSLGKKVGMIRINKLLTPGTKIIQTSLTGFYQKVLFEVPKE